MGLLWGKSAVEFSMNRTGRIVTDDGTFITRGRGGHRWRAEIKSSAPTRFVYRLAAASSSTREGARSLAGEIERKGFDVVIEQEGDVLRVGRTTLSDNRRYRVYLQKAFTNREEAEAYRDSVWNRLETFVVRRKAQRTRGILLLKNLHTDQGFESTRPVRIVGTPVTVYDVPVGTGFHWETLETRSYPETICIQLDNEGKLALINTLSLEEYLRGVVPSEMPEGFPSEALKAQAIAARGEILSKWGRIHKDDPFDVCADVHCQVYSGMTKRASSTDRAVRRTRGLVMWKDEKIAEAVYSSVCGGHGEDNENAWGGQPKSYLQGRFDGSGNLQRYGSLTDEMNLKRWIDDDPPAYCNTTGNGLPPALDYTKKYFRWEVRYTQDELRRILRDKTGRDVGPIQDLVPLNRGSSGRIIRLKVVGTQGEFVLEPELNIRKALSSNTLWSSCFYVQKEGRWSQAPGLFILKGAGFGHGVGMCQTGAAMMALQGHRFDQILTHYYKGVRLRRLY